MVQLTLGVKSEAFPTVPVSLPHRYSFGSVVWSFLILTGTVNEPRFPSVLLISQVSCLL